MGEYAKYLGAEIKIGTCESMYYLRYEDRRKVKHLPGNVDAARQLGLRFRLPFPDEDRQRPGEYSEYNRGLRLYRVRACGHDDFELPGSINEPGNIQLHHAASGLLLNVPCYHGQKLPEVSAPMRAFWNGKGHSFELMSVKATDNGVLPIVGCRHCGEMWRSTWEEVLPFVGDLQMRQRLEAYSNQRRHERVGT